MLVVGRIEHAGREQHDVRVTGSRRWRHRFEGSEQFIRIIFDRRYAMARKQFREEPHHDFTIFQHVRDAGRRARIIFKDVKCFGVDTHDVDTGNMHVNIVWYVLAAHLGTEGGIAEYKIVGDYARTQDFTGAINVLNEGVEGIDALGQALFEQAPFGTRHDARNDIERDQAFLRLAFAVNRKRDADAPED